MPSPYFVLLDDATQRKAQLYEHLVQIDTYQANELEGLQFKLQEKWAKQWHAVIWAPYDWGRELMGLGNSEGKGSANELRAAASKDTVIEVANTPQKGTELTTEHVPNNGRIQYLEHTPQNPSSVLENSLRIYWFAQKTELPSEAATQAWLTQQTDNDAPAGLAYIQLAQDKQSYERSIEQIREDIAAGEMYQINYTTELRFQAYGSPFKLYQKIRDKQRVPYGALAHLPNNLRNNELRIEKPLSNIRPQSESLITQNFTEQHNNCSDTAEISSAVAVQSTTHSRSQWTLSFSPELFLDIRQDGTIHTEPMKGTVPTADDGRNEERAAALRADPKNRAENVMIVDLLRNDLSKIAVPNGVHVPELFKVSNFGSVLQMTTPIQAMAKLETQVEDIFSALFPCGSITGAPKKRSMQLLDQYEARPRGLYTGSIGFLEPCAGGLGFHGKLNVVIRTLQMRECVSEEAHQWASVAERDQGSTKQHERIKAAQHERLDESTLYTPSPRQFTGAMGVGSGIVYDSDPALEYEECHWKARFLRHLPLDFGLFETMRVDIIEGVAQCRLLEQHMQRLQRSANDLGFKFNEADVRASLSTYLEKMTTGAHSAQAPHADNSALSNQATAADDASLNTQVTQVSGSTHQYAYRVKATLQGDGTLNIQHALLEPLSTSSESTCRERQEETCDDTLAAESDRHHENTCSERNESAYSDTQSRMNCAQEASTLLLADTPLANQDFLRRYKTTHRQHYDTQMHKAIEQGAFDTLCFNEDDILLEGARSSVFIYSQDQWLTPSVDLDILQSVMRADVLHNPEQWLGPYTPGHMAVLTAGETVANDPTQNHKVFVRECRISREQVLKADQIVVVNALRGVISARVVR